MNAQRAESALQQLATDTAWYGRRAGTETTPSMRDACWLAAGSGGARRGTQAPLVCSERGCGGRHGRRDALDAAVQADSGVRDAAVAVSGRPEEGDKGHRQRLYYP